MAILKRRKQILLQDMRNESTLERAFETRRYTLMRKAMQLEQACGVEVVVTIKTKYGVAHYYSSNQQTTERLKTCDLIGKYSQNAADVLNVISCNLPVVSESTKNTTKTGKKASSTIPEAPNLFMSSADEQQEVEKVSTSMKEAKRETASFSKSVVKPLQKSPSNLILLKNSTSLLNEVNENQLSEKDTQENAFSSSRDTNVVSPKRNTNINFILPSTNSKSTKTAPVSNTNVITPDKVETSSDSDSDDSTDDNYESTDDSGESTDNDSDGTTDNDSDESTDNDSDESTDNDSDEFIDNSGESSDNSVDESETSDSSVSDSSISRPSKKSCVPDIIKKSDSRLPLNKEHSRRSPLATDEVLPNVSSSLTGSPSSKLQSTISSSISTAIKMEPKEIEANEHQPAMGKSIRLPTVTASSTKSNGKTLPASSSLVIKIVPISNETKSQLLQSSPSFTSHSSFKPTTQTEQPNQSLFISKKTSGSTLIPKELIPEIIGKSANESASLSCSKSAAGLASGTSTLPDLLHPSQKESCRSNNLSSDLIISTSWPPAEDNGSFKCTIKRPHCRMEETSYKKLKPSPSCSAKYLTEGQVVMHKGKTLTTQAGHHKLIDVSWENTTHSCKWPAEETCNPLKNPNNLQKRQCRTLNGKPMLGEQNRKNVSNIMKKSLNNSKLSHSQAILSNRWKNGKSNCSKQKGFDPAGIKNISASTSKQPYSRSSLLNNNTTSIQDALDIESVPKKSTQKSNPPTHSTEIKSVKSYSGKLNPSEGASVDKKPVQKLNVSNSHSTEMKSVLCNSSKQNLSEIANVDKKPVQKSDVSNSHSIETNEKKSFALDCSKHNPSKIVNVPKKPVLKTRPLYSHSFAGNHKEEVKSNSAKHCVSHIVNKSMKQSNRSQQLIQKQIVNACKNSNFSTQRRQFNHARSHFAKGKPNRSLQDYSCEGKQKYSAHKKSTQDPGQVSKTNPKKFTQTKATTHRKFKKRTGSARYRSWRKNKQRKKLLNNVSLSDGIGSADISQQLGT